MSERPWLLDLFSGAGGAAMGYYQAGFEVYGVDKVAQPNYPFTFHEESAFRFLRNYDLSQFSAIHASPPCQGYSVTKHLHGRTYPLWIDRTRKLLELTGLPYVIENVEGAMDYMVTPTMLCGSSFGLRVRRHRLFETNWDMEGLECEHNWQNEHKPYQLIVGRERGASVRSGIQPVYGGNQNLGGRSVFYKSVAMGIDWMNELELNQAIPPVYSNFVGRQLMKQVLN